MLEISDVKKDIRTLLARLAVFLLLLAIYIAVSMRASTGLDITHTSLYIHNLPQGLDDLRIAQITDLHSSRFGDGQSELINAISEFKPDLIVITGDFIDGIHPDEEPCMELVRGLSPIAPVYRVRGNHEYYLDDTARATFDAEMAACGAILLDNQSVVLEKNNQRYLLSGMDDVTKLASEAHAKNVDSEQFFYETAEGFMSVIQKTMPYGDYPLKIMLSHQPHYWQVWQESGYDLALCGHLHGWIARQPMLGGLLRMSSKYFPEEDAGLYDKQGMLLYISRGLDNMKSWRNIRMNNKPELAMFTISAK
jgi:uncharacterized protein